MPSALERSIFVMSQSTNTKELAKSFEPADIEARWYPIWEKRGYFDAGLDPNKPGFAIQLPPPNITGILHIWGTPSTSP